MCNTARGALSIDRVQYGYLSTVLPNTRATWLEWRTSQGPSNHTTVAVVRTAVIAIPICIIREPASRGRREPNLVANRCTRYRPNSNTPDVLTSTPATNAASAPPRCCRTTHRANSPRTGLAGCRYGHWPWLREWSAGRRSPAPWPAWPVRRQWMAPAAAWQRSLGSPRVRAAASHALPVTTVVSSMASKPMSWNSRRCRFRLSPARRFTPPAIQLNAGL